MRGEEEEDVQTDAGYSHLRGRTAGHAALFHDARAHPRATLHSWPHTHTHTYLGDESSVWGT